MKPADTNRTSLDPRAFVRQHGEAALAAVLREKAAYVPQERPLLEFCESIDADVPLLAEGGAGSGKTAFGEALAAAFNMPLYYLQCVPGLSISDVLYSWPNNPPAWTREYLYLCDLLAAYDHCAHHPTIPLLLIDEVDKTELRIENMMLQPLGRRYAHIPRLQPSSLVGLTDPNRPGPVVIITSNNQRELTEPFRSRCINTHFRSPTPAEEVAIMRATVRDITPLVLQQSLKMFYFVRGQAAITSKPGLRESIRFLQAVSRKRISSLDAGVIDRHLCHFARNNGDKENLLLKLSSIERVINLPHAEIDAWVDAAYSAAAPLEVLAA